MDVEWIKVPEDHPEKCETASCLNKRMEGSKFCAAHGGNKGADATKARELKNYRIAKWNKKLLEKKDSSEIKSLTEEIAILREILQAHMMACNDETDLILKSQPIADLVTKIDKLVNSCNNIDKTLGNLIEKEKVVLFAKTIVDVITPYIPEEKLDELNLKIQDSIGVL